MSEAKEIVDWLREQAMLKRVVARISCITTIAAVQIYAEADAYEQAANYIEAIYVLGPQSVP